MKNVKVWLALALVFFAGFAGGIVTTRAIARRVLRAALAHPERVQHYIERDLDRKLKLDTRQQAEVHRVVVQAREQLSDLRQEFQPRVSLILSEARREISAVLTPEQQKRFEDYLASHPLPPGLGTGASPENKRP